MYKYLLIDGCKTNFVVAGAVAAIVYQMRDV